MVMSRRTRDDRCVFRRIQTRSLRVLVGMLVIHDWNASPNSLKTKILLYELGIPFENRHVDGPVIRGEAFRAKYPLGQVPAIEDDGFRLAESGAIALYLAEKHGGALLAKTPAQRALMFQAMAIESSLLTPTMGGQGLFGELAKPVGERNERRIADLGAKAQRIAAMLGEVLGDKTWFAEMFTIADIQLYSATAKSIEAGAFQSPPRALVDWCNRMTERPSVARAREEYIHYAKRTPTHETAARA